MSSRHCGISVSASRSACIGERSRGTLATHRALTVCVSRVVAPAEEPVSQPRQPEPAPSPPPGSPEEPSSTHVLNEFIDVNGEFAWRRAYKKFMLHYRCPECPPRAYITEDHLLPWLNLELPIPFPEAPWVLYCSPAEMRMVGQTAPVLLSTVDDVMPFRPLRDTQEQHTHTHTPRKVPRGRPNLHGSVPKLQRRPCGKRLAGR